MGRNKLGVGVKPGLDRIDGGVAAAERVVAGGVGCELESGDVPTGFPAEDLGELGGVELERGRGERQPEGLEFVAFHVAGGSFSEVASDAAKVT
jgi:hypothetical protein